VNVVIVSVVVVVIIVVVVVEIYSYGWQNAVCPCLGTGKETEGGRGIEGEEEVFGVCFR